MFGTRGTRPGYDRWQIFSLNLLGDPELRVYRHAVPGLKVRVTNPRSSRPIEVYVEQVPRPPRPPQPDPAPDVLVVLRQGDLVITRRTDADGIAHVDADLFGPGPLEVTASHEDSPVHQQVVEIAEAEWVTGRVVGVLIVTPGQLTPLCG